MTKEFLVFVSGIKMSRRKHIYTHMYILIHQQKENLYFQLIPHVEQKEGKSMLSWIIILRIKKNPNNRNITSMIEIF